MPADPNNAGLNVWLPFESKEIIDQAAALLGLSVNDFAIGSLVQAARSVLHQQRVTVLSNRDRDILIALLTDVEARPNEALIEAARKYNQHPGR